MFKMAVSSVVIMMVLFTSVLQVDGSYFYPLHKALESALITEETLFTLKQVFFPIEHSSAQETQQVQISICVEITVDQALNSTKPCNLNADKSSSSNNVSCLCWDFLWTDSALLSLITADQLIAFDVLTGLIYRAATARYYTGYNRVSLPLVCSVLPKESDIKASLILLLSWVRYHSWQLCMCIYWCALWYVCMILLSSSQSESYVRHHGVPPQWEKTDKGYIQEVYDARYVSESTYKKYYVHSIRQGLIISFTLLNILVLIGVLSYGQQCYKKVHRITSGSTRLSAVTWAFMITVLLMNSLYLASTLYELISLKHPDPRIWTCLVSDADWCASVKLTKLYSDVVGSLLVKLTVVPFTIVVELIIAVRLTSHTLLPFPCTMATRSQCCSFRNGKRVIETILIWNVMVFIQIIFGVALLPVGILMVIAPVSTISYISIMFIFATAICIYRLNCIYHFEMV